MNGEAAAYWVPRLSRGTTAVASLQSSLKHRLHVPQSLQFHPHVITRIEPQRLDQAAGEHDLAGVQAFAFGRKVVGEPGERVVGMTAHVGAAAAPCFAAVDEAAVGG